MAAVFLLAGNPVGAWAAEPLRVLVLNSYHQGYGWTDQQLAGIRETLGKSRRPVIIHVEDLDRKRESDSGYLGIFRQYLAAKYRSKPIDVVIATDNDALNFLKEHRASALGPIPLVFSGINFFGDDMLTGLAPATGVAETFEGDKSIALMRELHPEAERIVVIVDGTTTGVRLQRELGEIIAEDPHGFEYQLWANLSLAEIKHDLAKLRPIDLVLLMPFARDSEDRYIEFADMAELVAEHSTRPVYGAWDFYMGHGIVGGWLTTARAQGRAAAELVLRVLAGEDIDTIDVVHTVPTEPVFDARQLERHGIRASGLPDGSTVLFRPWGEENRLLLALGGCLAAMTLLASWAWIRKASEKRTADRGLRESEQRFRDLAVISSDWIWEIDNHGTYTYVSPDIERILGVLPEDVLGKAPFSLMQSAEAEKTAEVFAGIVTLQKPFRDLRNVKLHKDGREIVFLTSGVPIFDEDGKLRGWRGADKDITTQDRMQKQLDKERLRLQAFLTTASDGIHVVDSQGTLVDANEAFLDMLGYDRHIVGRMRVTEWDATLDHAAFDQMHASILEQGGDRLFETRHHCSDGRLIDVEVHVNAVTVGEDRLLFAASRDISERKNQEAELRKLAQAVEQSQASILITNRHGEIEFVNDAFVRNSGYGRDEVTGRNPRMLSSGDTPAEIYQAMWQALNAGGPWKGEFHNRRKDGTTYIELAIVSPIRQSNGVTSHFVSVQEDITEKKQLARELDRYRHHLEGLVDKRTAELADAKQRAESANQAKSVFLANMSHEIRTPMTAIIGMSERALRTELDEKQRNYIEKAHVSARNLLQILNDILDFSKIESGKFELEDAAFALDTVLHEVMQVIGSLAEEKRLSLNLDVEPMSLPGLRGDPLRLKQVLLNLGGNAVKFTEKGGIGIHVRTESEDDETATLKFSVADTGIGISDGQQSRLFQAFSQADSSTSRRFGGTGLGLAISKDLVTRMGGRLWLESAPGVGSTFHFTARFTKTVFTDALSRIGPGIDPLPLRAAAQRLRGTHLLLAEDNVINQELLMELLADFGIRVTAVGDGKEVIEALSSTRFDGVLMDCQMPVMDGFTATRQLRSQPEFRDLPILALTANVTEEQRQRALQAGMDDFVAKPIDIDQLMQVLVRCLSTGDVRHATDTGDDQPHDQVPAQIELVGIDTVAALKVVRGKYRLLEKGLRMFLERFGEFENSFRSASSDVDGGAATREAHSLKGIAANLGMHDVREAAERLEAACLTEPEEIESRLDDVVKSLEPVLEALKTRFAA